MVHFFSSVRRCSRVGRLALASWGWDPCRGHGCPILWRTWRATRSPRSPVGCTTPWHSPRTAGECGGTGVTRGLSKTFNWRGKGGYVKLQALLSRSGILEHILAGGTPTYTKTRGTSPFLIPDIICCSIVMITIINNDIQYCVFASTSALC